MRITKAVEPKTLLEWMEPLPPGMPMISPRSAPMKLKECLLVCCPVCLRREIAVEILQQEVLGAFIVRESKSHPGCFALSIKVDGDFNETGIANYLVVRTKNGGYTIKVITINSCIFLLLKNLACNVGDVEFGIISKDVFVLADINLIFGFFMLGRAKK